jgi:DNA-binding NtrC family response regulator
MAQRQDRVLSISDDDGLRLSREMLLRSDGYEPVSVSSQECAKNISGTFDIAILCQSVDPDCADDIAQRLRRDNPQIRILQLRPIGQRTIETYYDAECEVLPDPKRFLETVACLCSGASRTRPRPQR